MGFVGTASLTISEMREFAGFSPREQRYVERSLDVGLERGDAVAMWARHPGEAAAIGRQYRAYRALRTVRRCAADGPIGGLGAGTMPLLELTVFDLGEGSIDTFAAYRFLYERLMGAGVRPVLPSAFCAAAALPAIAPVRRKALLQSLSEAAATAEGWSARRPRFFPVRVAAEAA